MTQGIKVGDWIRFPVDGLESRGKVLQIDGEAYGVKMEVGGYTVVPKGDKVRKIAPPEGEE